MAQIASIRYLNPSFTEAGRRMNEDGMAAIDGPDARRDSTIPFDLPIADLRNGPEASLSADVSLRRRGFALTKFPPLANGSRADREEANTHLADITSVAESKISGGLAVSILRYLGWTNLAILLF